MKRILAGMLALVLFATTAQAQKQDITDHGKGHHDKLKKELNLTDEQKTKLKSIREQERKDIKVLHDKYQDQRESVFTPDQKNTLESLKAERKEKGKGRKHHGGKHKHFKKRAEFQNQLNLTQNQKDKMQKMRIESKGRFDALEKDESLSKEQKREKMMSLKKEQHEKMKSILTKDQIEKLESAKKTHRSESTK